MTDDYLGPEPTRDETAADQEREYEIQRWELMAERDKYEAALRKLATWKGYPHAPRWFSSDKPLTDYEEGANDMLETLQQFVKEALA